MRYLIPAVLLLSACSTIQSPEALREAGDYVDTVAVDRAIEPTFQRISLMSERCFETAGFLGGGRNVITHQPDEEHGQVEVWYTDMGARGLQMLIDIESTAEGTRVTSRTATLSMRRYTKYAQHWLNGVDSCWIENQDT